MKRGDSSVECNIRASYQGNVRGENVPVSQNGSAEQETGERGIENVGTGVPAGISGLKTIDQQPATNNFPTISNLDTIRRTGMIPLLR